MALTPRRGRCYSGTRRADGALGLLSQLERRIADFVEGGFARLFRGRLQPEAVLRAVEEHVERREHRGLAVATNAVVVRCCPADLVALGARQASLCREAAQRLRRVAESRGWPLVGRPAVRLSGDPTVAPGCCEVDLSVVEGPGEASLEPLAGGPAFELVPHTVIVGRDPSCEFTLDHPDISRRHASIEPRGPDYVVTDLGSTNGTTVNGAAVTSMPLRDGDVVAFGPLRYRYRER